MKKDSNLTISVLIGFGGLCLGGCDSSSSPTNNGNIHSALLAPCSLLSNAEAASIMGKPVDSVSSDTSSGYITHCSYMGSVDTGYYLPTHIDFTVVTTAGLQSHLGPTQNVPAAYNGQKANYTVANEVWLMGIGDDAYWYKTSGNLYFYKGDVKVDVQYRPHGTPLVDTSAEAQAGSTLAAQNIAARL